MDIQNKGGGVDNVQNEDPILWLLFKQVIDYGATPGKPSGSGKYNTHKNTNHVFLLNWRQLHRIVLDKKN